MALQRTFVMIKPDGVVRGLVFEIMQKFERKGWKLIGAKFTVLTEEIAKEHYSHLADKPFFPDLIKYITSATVFMSVWEGENIVEEVRKLVGATDPLQAQPGTIRFDYSQFVGRNVIHASDSVETAEKEIARFFKPEELVDWKHPLENFLRR